MSEGVHTKPWPKVAALLLVPLIFVAIGPAIGALALWVGSNFSAITSGAFNIATFFSGFMFVLFFAYLIGSTLALVAGIFVAVVGLWLRWNNILVPFAAAAVSVLLAFYLLPLSLNLNLVQMHIGWTFLVCLLATFVCWFLTRGIVRRAWPSA